MREVNFSIPSVNKAAVSITTTLYDRRALDCTSTLPLINSLNHLAYLTTSSARIRDILTVDGGVERLVCILKEGRSRDLMEMWKWNLAFQCIVNIGVRGSENVRTRVVEADMVPVIATILDNYIQVVDKLRGTSEPEPIPFKTPKFHSRSRDLDLRTAFERTASSILDHRTTRRQAPPPSIEIPLPFIHDSRRDRESSEPTPSPQMVLTSPPERTVFREVHHSRRLFPSGMHRHRIMQPLATAVPSIIENSDAFGLRPVRDADRLPSQVPPLQNGITSQPESPTTPHTTIEPQPIPQYNGRNRRGSFVRQQRSASTESDDGDGTSEDVVMADDSGDLGSDTIVGLPSGMEIEGVGDQDTLMDDGPDSHSLALPTQSDDVETDTFPFTRSSTSDGSQQGNSAIVLDQGQVPDEPIAPAPSQMPLPFLLHDRTMSHAVLTAMPRDEDVLMALQLLAYVSKYCSLRSYFQNTHLVPKLKLGKDASMLEDTTTTWQSLSPTEVGDTTEEYLLADDFNIFPLVEKFTVRHHTKDMQYWACVVMRNLCRKDDSRGGIRQCAYYKCGKWEEFQRQFAKCRRCRRTKYCSKECQKSAWVYHRHWCHSSP